MSFLDNAKRAFSSRADEFYDDDRDYDETYDDELDEEEPRKPLFSFLSRKADTSDAEYEDDEEEYTPRHRTSRDRYSSSYSRQQETPQAAPRANLSGVNLTVHYPESFDDASRIIKEVKFNKITVFDISTIKSDDEARRVVDYIGGAAEGMECPFSRLCPSIFCIAPKGVIFDIKKPRY